MNTFDKERWDVSKIFLAYLAFLGNATKVSIALGMRPEVVEVLAAKENWDEKLKTYVGLRHKKVLPQPDSALRKTATHIQACFLRDVIDRVTAHLFKMSPDELLDSLSPRCRRSNRPKFNNRTLLDLMHGYSLATRLIDRLENRPHDEPENEELSEKERLQIREAIAKAMHAADSLPGMDSVALAKDSLAKWQNG